jgi:ornithine decarboxylase
MKNDKTLWATPFDFLTCRQPDWPVAFFCAPVLHDTAHRFLRGFDGVVSYAVKANADTAVITNLHAAGIKAFDVASPVEIDLVRALAPLAALHYNNPVRSRSEIAHAVDAGVRSWSVDSPGEFAKLAALVPKGAEISVRLRLPIKGAAYDFGEKFGADAVLAAELLRRVKAAGFMASMTFHPGTQCHDPGIWVRYIQTCAKVATQAGVILHRLNVGGGFPARRSGMDADLAPIFRAISEAANRAFPERPQLVCEPGRAMVSDAFSLASRIKAIHDNGVVYLNDGIYGGLTEFRDLNNNHEFAALSPNGDIRHGSTQARVVFGPTCDSLDKLPAPLPLPCDLQEEDYLLFAGMGAYVNATCTRFNGYGDIQTVMVNRL